MRLLWPGPILLVLFALTSCGTGAPDVHEKLTPSHEIAAQAACKAYLAAQETFYQRPYHSEHIPQYAQALRGDNSLYESKDGLGDFGLIDRNFALAQSDLPNAAPKVGYLFKILKAQGPGAEGGRKSYMDGNRMTTGYALVAYPYEWNNSGVNTFMINQSGAIYMKNLGPKTADIVARMTEYDPDPAQGWTAAN